MCSFAVIVHLHVFKDLLLCFFSCFEPAPINLLDFKRVQEAFTDGIVPAVVFAAHARYYQVLLKQLLVITACVLTAPVGFDIAKPITPL